MNSNPVVANLEEARSDVSLPARSGGLFATHWRGDYSLPRSYWMNGVVIYHIGINMLLLMVLGVALAVFKGKAALVLIVGLGEVALLCAAYVWALVGIWRAARKYQGWLIWSILARLAILFGVLLSIGNLLNMLDMIGRATEH
ncbi:MAG TPA: hypothetical protein VGQ99_23495 [Tepidisphaeraceae bacterium]|nr:hypothetical protein [Tepidisphaeraceae bacterium]